MKNVKDRISNRHIRPRLVAIVLAATIALLTISSAISYRKESVQIKLDRLLEKAVIKFHLKSVRLLLKQGANPSARLKQGDSDASIEVIFKRLLGHVFHPRDSWSNGRPVLLYSIQNRTDSITQALLEKGADPNAIGEYELKPPYGRSTLVYGPNRSSLALAVTMGYPRICSMLLDHGAKPDLIDGSGESPLVSVVLLYLNINAQVGPDPKPKLRTDVILFAWFRGAESDDERKILKREHDDSTLFLRYLCMQNIRLLVQKHANPEIKDATGKSAMDYAKAAHNRELEDILKGNLTPAIK